MQVTRTKRPDNVLFRWGDDGVLQGAHIQHIEVTTAEDGTLVNARMLDPLPISMSGGEGFPIADVLEQIQVGSVEAMEAAKADAAAARKLLEDGLIAADVQVAAAEKNARVAFQEVGRLNTVLQAALARIAELQGPGGASTQGGGGPDPVKPS